MSRVVLAVFVFLSVNLLLFFFHQWVFRGPLPFLAWATSLAHALALILFPYSKVMNRK